MSKNKKKIKDIENGNLGASDIVNGTASLYEIKEMESALNHIYKEIGVKDFE